MKIMKTLFLYNPSSGKGLSNKKIDKILTKLRHIFEDVDYQECLKPLDVLNFAQNSCGKYDALIFAGGDGTFHQVVNGIASQEVRPILGVIPCGTLNDACKNFGYSTHYSKSLRIFQKPLIQTFDIFQVNDTYGVFSLSAGTFSNIPYAVKSRSKKKIGRFSYYQMAFKELGNKEKISGTIVTSTDQKINYRCSFLLALNSQFMGGFKINPSSDMNDGRVDLFYTDKGWFNGLFRYFFRRHKIQHYELKEYTIINQQNVTWDVDGEPLSSSQIHLKVLQNHIKIFSK